MTPEGDSHNSHALLESDLNAAVATIERCLSICREPQPVRDTIEMIRWLAANDHERFEQVSEEAASLVKSSETEGPKPAVVPGALGKTSE